MHAWSTGNLQDDLRFQHCQSGLLLWGQSQCCPGSTGRGYAGDEISQANGGCTVGGTAGSTAELAMAGGVMTQLPFRELVGVMASAFMSVIPRWSGSSGASVTSSGGIVGGLLHLLLLFAQGCIMIATTTGIAGLSLGWTLAWGMGVATFVTVGIGG